MTTRMETTQITKDWFRHEFGYVNIDAENVYLTNSGNWSETKLLVEKNTHTIKKSQKKTFRKKAFLYGSILLFGMLLLLSFSNMHSGVLLPILLVFGGYYLYQDYKPELGLSFLIPLKKLITIEINNEEVVLHFTNADGEHDHIELKKVTPEGILILEKMFGEEEKFDNKLTP